MMSIMPSQKFGTEMPNRETVVARWSKMEYCFVAANIPSGTPIHSATTMLSSASSAVVGNRSRISPVTDRPLE